MKHVQNVHYLHDLKEAEEALANPKAHWDDLEDKKVRLRGVETRLQGRALWIVAWKNMVVGVLKGNVA